MFDPELWGFFCAWLRAPGRIAAVVPSGGNLSRLMASQALSGGDGIVVELGAGTGAITAALLNQGIAPQRLVAVERSYQFSALLRRKFPAVKVVCADASDLCTSLRRACVDEPVRTIISGLPLLAMEAELRQRIVGECCALLGAEGKLVQFTYGPLSPVSGHLRRRLGLRARRIGQVWSNLPPATVWCYTRACVPAAA
ncbi:MAG: methyltransferase domain-containing protein [Gammaproteobacteria bacterium]|nr:methyltransferase domain-containing protein [Gammaproteobacteria bacterium]